MNYPDLNDFMATQDPAQLAQIFSDHARKSREALKEDGPGWPKQAETHAGICHFAYRAYKNNMGDEPSFVDSSYDGEENDFEAYLEMIRLCFELDEEIQVE